jgi:hypothetical protein
MSTIREAVAQYISEEFTGDSVSEERYDWIVDHLMNVLEDEMERACFDHDEETSTWIRGLKL